LAFILEPFGQDANNLFMPGACDTTAAEDGLPSKLACGTDLIFNVSYRDTAVPPGCRFAIGWLGTPFLFQQRSLEELSDRHASECLSPDGRIA